MPRTFRRKSSEQEKDPLLAVHQERRSPFESSPTSEQPTTAQRKMENPKLQLKRAQTYGFKFGHQSAPIIQRTRIAGQSFSMNEYDEVKNILEQSFNIPFTDVEEDLLEYMLEDNRSYRGITEFADAFQVLRQQNLSSIDDDDLSLADSNQQFGLQDTSFTQSAKNTWRGAKHLASAAKRRTMFNLGFSNNPEREMTSGDTDQISFVLSEADQSVHSEDKGTARKAGGGLVKKTFSNISHAATAGRKAHRMGTVKQDLTESLDDSSVDRSDVEELILVTNSLRGAFKRQAVYESTIGSLKKLISAGITALTGAPGLGSVLTAAAEEVAIQGGTSLTSSAASYGTDRLSPQQRFVGGGGQKLTEEQWVDVFLKYLSTSHPLQDEMKSIIHGAFLDTGKADILIHEATIHPRVAAQIMVAVQQGADKKKTITKCLKKAARQTP